VHHFVKSVTGKTTHESINISPLMSPQARVIAYYTSGGEVVSDSLVLEIVKSCGNEVGRLREKGLNSLKSHSLEI
jgi:hypothetical protein